MLACIAKNRLFHLLEGFYNKWMFIYTHIIMITSLYSLQSDRFNNNHIQFFQKYWSVYTTEVQHSSIIQRHLQSESAFLYQVLQQKEYDTVIEIGCADGSFGLDCIQNINGNNGRFWNYYGIELVPEAAEKARAKGVNSSDSVFQVITGDACQILGQTGVSSFHGGKILVTFPFNSFGTIHCPLELIRNCASRRFDLLIFGYLTSEKANQTRQQFYTDCGFTDIVSVHNESGVLFKSSEGLCSYAYYTSVLRNWLDGSKYLVAETPLSILGTVFFSVLKAG